MVAAGEVEIEQDGQTVSGGSGLRGALRPQGAPRGARDDRRARCSCSWRHGRARGIPASASIRRVDPSRKRKLRLVVALTAAVLLATALIYTSFSASTEASKPSELKPGRSYDAHRQGRRRARSATGRRPPLPGARPRRHRVGAGLLHGRGARPVPRGPRGDRLRRARARHVRRPSATRSSRSARRSSRRTSSRAEMAGVGSACLAVALLTAAYAVGASLYGARSGRREWVTSGRRAIYCVAAPLRDRVRAARGGLPALGLLVRAGRRGVLDQHADLLQGDGAVGDPGRVAPPVGHAPVAVRLDGAVPHPPLAARHRALRHRRTRRDRRLLPAADGGLGEPLRHAGERRPPKARASTRCSATRR